MLLVPCGFIAESQRRTMRIHRCYSELRRLETFEERFRYLKIPGVVGESTFGFDRYLNQTLYTSPRWRSTRNEVIIRDCGCDLGIPDREIGSGIIVHHMNPITLEDIEDRNEDIFNPEFLICVSRDTHLAIHYSNESLLASLPKERSPGDTLLWPSISRRKEE